MIDTVTFLNSHLIWQIGAAGLLLWMIFIWKEFSQFGTNKFWVKIFVSFLAIISLMAIALQPVASTSPKTSKTVLLTKGYNKEQLDSLKRVHKKIEVLPYKVNYPIFDNETVSDSVFLLGYGLESFDFWQLNNRWVQYMPGSEPSGIVRYKYDQRNNVGERIFFTGLYNNPEKGNKLLLEEPGGTIVDSVILKSGRHQKFQLAANLNIKGNYLFSITEKDSLGNLLSKDPVPVVVQEATSLKILVLNNFPTFETKYLKNYLASLGHEMIVKSKITKGRHKFEYFNTEKKRIGVLSKKNLETFDLVIIDATSLRNLGRKSRTALENSIRKNGLGVFIQPNNNFFKTSKNIGSFDFVSDKREDISLKDFPKNKIPKSVFSFKNEFGILPIHQDTKDKTISAYKRIGNGRVGTTTLENTYELLLRGNSNVYKQIWSAIIGALSNKNLISSQWQSDITMGFKDQPFEFSLRTSIEKPTVQTMGRYTIPLRRGLSIENLWHGTMHPNTLGWEKLSVQQDSTMMFNYFVADTLHWRSQKDYDKIQKNRRYFDQFSSLEEDAKLLKPINPLWFFFIFLLCIGFLWLEPKINKE